MTSRRIDREGMRLLTGLLAAPLAWTVHLMGSYLVLTVGCALGWGGTQLILIILTVVLAAVALLSAVAVLRQWPRPLRPLQWIAQGESEAPVPNFLLGLGVLLTGLFVMAILMGGFGTLLVPLCAMGSHH